LVLTAVAKRPDTSAQVKTATRFASACGAVNNRVVGNVKMSKIVLSNFIKSSIECRNNIHPG
jgi:hypothetical protein